MLCSGDGEDITTPLEFFSVAASLAVGVCPVGGLEAEGTHVLPLGVILGFQTHSLIESPTCFHAWFCGGTVGVG